MKSTFHEYYRPTEDEFSHLWKNAIFTFDASVLLSVYGYTTKTRNALIDLIAKYHDRIWLPHQFALEYSRRRVKIIIDQIENYEKTINSTKSVQASLISGKNHPYLDEDAFKACNALLEKLEGGKKEFELIITKDLYAESILGLFDKKVGEAFAKEELAKVHADAAQRYKDSVPPGFRDLKEKPVPRAYGDYIGWRQIMNFASSEKRPIILVIDDKKEDWWYKEKGRTIGPLAALRKEFMQETDQYVYMYTSDHFLKIANELSGGEVPTIVMREVEQRAEYHRAMQEEEFTEKDSEPSNTLTEKALTSFDQPKDAHDEADVEKATHSEKE